MLRATVWTMGLFGAGTAISRAFPSSWTEPLVLFALGIALLFVSARTSPAAPRPSEDRPGRAAPAEPALRATAPTALAATAAVPVRAGELRTPAPVPVEQSV